MISLLLLLLLLSPFALAVNSESQTPVFQSESTSASPEFYDPNKDDYHCPRSLETIFGHKFGDGDHIYEDDLAELEGTIDYKRFRDLMTLKNENHPNSTDVDDVVDADNGVNTTTYREGLQYVIDNMFQDNSAVSNVSRDLAIRLLAYGSGYVATFEIDLEGVRYVSITAFTFRTSIIESYMQRLNLTLPAPFTAGVYTDFDHDKHQTHIFGAAFGLELFFDHRNGQFVPFIPPQTAVGLFDAIVPLSTRDFDNEDGDVVSKTTEITGNSYLGGAPVVMKLAAAFLNDTIYVNFNDIFEESDLNNGYNTAIVDSITVPTANFRMGNGLDEQGIRGALPVVDSLYVTFDLTIRAFENDPVVKLPGMGRFLTSIFSCVTNCPHSATHIMDNHIDFDMSSIVPPSQTLAFHTSSYEGITSDVYTDLFETIPDALYSKNGNNPEPYSGQHYSIRGGLGAFVSQLQIGEGQYTNVLAATQFNHEIAETVFNNLSPAAQEYITGTTGVQLKDFGIFLNLREAPVLVDVFGVTTGLSFFADPYNITGTLGSFIPNAVLISFASGENVRIQNGIRVPDGKNYLITNEIVNGLGGMANFKFVITGINDDGISHVPNDQIPFGLTRSDDSLEIGVFDTENPTQVEARGMFHSTAFAFAEGVNATIHSTVRPCINLFHKRHGIRNNGQNPPTKPNSIVSMVAVGVMVFSMLYFIILMI